MRAKSLFALGGMFLLLGSGSLQAAGGDPVAGREKAETCMGCHGVPGYRNAYPAYQVPKLGGQHAEYLVSALQAYQRGDRQHPTMRALTANMSEEEMRDIAAFFAQSE
ncbi:cytochrome C [Alkalilimnicola ehrlichii]|uniref:Cytochrome C n=1 Tax=Alkalilimnicola ehrlichii TaxID=351052 RepID=A0A3E0WYD8_9GAMM|nr:c-type cytochrome [Alkalilimnicola ehrlichii]RFA30441.1 cytochrome C [Alkalilimnicola ehrlichii]RFA37992.1 cytochrome C [Alkalilimnicola ehrlichii]